MTNILLVMADQLAASALRAYGNRVVDAPAIDRLASEGLVFDAAYCASPLCAPSRSALLTGRPPSATGVYDNAAELPASVPTVTHVLRAAGAATCLSGKMHFVGPDQLHGYEQRLTTDVYPAGFDWTPDWTLPEGEPVAWYHNMTSLRQAGVVEAAMQTDYDDEVAFRAVQWLRDRSRGGDRRPFFLTVSFTNPHDPWEVRREHWDRYEGVDVGLPRVGAIPLDQADPHSRRLRGMYGSDQRPLDEAEMRAARRAYFAAISYLDDRVAEVLAALESTGQADDTVVVLTADHGEMLGERGLWYKMSFFEGSARVPLIVRGPGVRRGREPEPVSQLDLAPTFCDLFGATAAARFPGRSLVPALGEAGSAPGRAACEYLAEGVAAPALMLREGPHKYIRCGEDPEQLYDLAGDPDELTNRAGDPELSDVLEELRAEADQHWHEETLEREVLASQRARRIVAAGLAQGAHTPWDFQPLTDASLQFVRGERAHAERPWRLRPGGALPDDAEP